MQWNRREILAGVTGAVVGASVGADAYAEVIDPLIVQPPDCTIGDTLVVGIGTIGVATAIRWAETGGHVLLVDRGVAGLDLPGVPRIDVAAYAWAAEARRTVEEALGDRHHIAIVGADRGETVRAAQPVIEEIADDLVESWMTLFAVVGDERPVLTGVCAPYSYVSTHMTRPTDPVERASRVAEAPAVLWDMLVEHVIA